MSTLHGADCNWEVAARTFGKAKMLRWMPAVRAPGKSREQPHPSHQVIAIKCRGDIFAASFAFPPAVLDLLEDAVKARLMRMDGDAISIAKGVSHADHFRRLGWLAANRALISMWLSCFTLWVWTLTGLSTNAVAAFKTRF